MTAPYEPNTKILYCSTKSFSAIFYVPFRRRLVDKLDPRFFELDPTFYEAAELLKDNGLHDGYYGMVGGTDSAVFLRRAHDNTFLNRAADFVLRHHRSVDQIAERLAALKTNYELERFDPDNNPAHKHIFDTSELMMVAGNPR